jgi:tetratricopeptide (TPR) repeat protein
MLLKLDPSNARALEAKTSALIELKRYDEANVVVARWLEVEPLSLSAHARRISILTLLGRPPAEIATDLDVWKASHPTEDARFELLRSMCDAAAGDRDASVGWLRKAAKRTPPDDAFAQVLVAQFAAVGDAGEDVTVLRDLVAGGAGSILQRMLLCRLWEVGQFTESDEVARRINLHDPSIPVSVVALASLCATASGREADAAARREIVSGRKGPAAVAWSTILGSSTRQPAGLRTLTTQCREALAREPRDPYLRYYLGEALAGLQETELAIETFEEAANSGVGWGRPLSRISELLLQRGNLNVAAQAAILAFRRTRNVDTAVAVARIATALDQAGAGPQHDALMTLVDQVQQAAPANEEVAAFRVHLLARAGRKEDAVKAVRSLLASAPPPSESLLLRLVSISRAQALGVDAEIATADEKLHGVTPALALNRALEELAAGRTSQGLEALRAAKGRAAPSAASSAWDMAEARYLDLAGDPLATGAWRSLAERYPDDADAQQAVLTARAVQDDRPLLEQTIRRLQHILGDESLVCALARVRLLVRTRAGDADDREIAERLNQIIAAHPRMPEPRVLWAQSLQRMGKSDEAIDQLQVALNANPDATSLALRLAELYRYKGDFDHARQLLERVAASKVRTPAELKAAARMLAQQGEYERATAVLEELAAKEGGGGNDLALADLYWRRNQPDKAEAVLAGLLETSRPDVLEYAARFYAAQGKEADAQGALARLDKIDLQPGRKQLARGNFFASTGRTDEAVAQYREATATAPKDPLAWRAMIAYLFAIDRAPDASAAIEAASAASGADPWLVAVKGAAPALSAVARFREMRSTVTDFLRDPVNNTAALDAITVVARSAQTPDPAASVSDARSLSQRYPRIEGVQLWTIGTYLRARRFQDAGAALTRALTTFADSADVAALATNFHASQQRWTEMLDAARQWRARSPDRSAPDAAIAQALLGLNRPAEAVAQLEPYFKSGNRPESQPPDRALLYAQALHVAGQAPRAEELLLPMASLGMPWRAVCLRFASEQLDEPQARRWIDRVTTASVANASTEEAASIARAWETLAVRYPASADCRTEATRRYAEIAARPDAPAAALEAAAMFAERAGDPRQAMTLYRRALALEPQRTASLNDLAFLLATHGGSLDEATKLMTAALQRNPNEPEFLDTMALIRAKAGDHDAAARHLRRAAETDPENLRWRVALVNELLDGNNAAEAGKALAVIDTMGADLSRQPDSIREKLDELRSRLKAKVGDGSTPAASAR